MSGYFGFEESVYSVDLPEWLSDTQTGVLGPCAMPQGLSRSLSTVGAPLLSVTMAFTV